MKKIFLILTLIIACFGSTSVLASEYAPEDNSYTNDKIKGSKTVLIYKGDSSEGLLSENIYYIDQCNEVGGFSSFKALLKNNIEEGTYTVVTNGGNIVATFTVSDAQLAVFGSTKLEYLDSKQTSAGRYCAAYGFNAEGITEETQLMMVLGDKAYSMPLKDAFGGALPSLSGSLAVQFDYIDAEYMNGEKPSFQIFIK